MSNAPPELEAALIKDFKPQTLRVYADWLEERGNPLAELIRVQLETYSDYSSRLPRGRSSCATARWSTCGWSRAWCTRW